jgi:peptide/nickel transport system ATP-binding protein
MSLLEARGLTVSTRLRGELLPVIRGLDLSLDEGGVLGLVGESGAGKSMIGRTIAQLMPPGFAVTAGSLDFAGESLVGMRPARRRALLGREIAFIPQEPLTALNPVLTILQQLAGKAGAGAGGLGVRASRSCRRVARALPASAFGRHVPTGADRDGVRERAAAGGG